MHAPLDVIAENLERGLACELAFCLVKRPDHLAAQAQDFARFHQRQHDLLAGARIREADDGAHRTESADDFRRADHDARAGAGQTDFRQAVGEDHMRFPERLSAAEDDAGKRRAVGIVEDERDAVTLRQGGKPGGFLVG